MKILITGGAGFIGTHLCKKLLDEGCTVRVLDNFSEQIHGKDPNFENGLSEVEIVRGDIRDKSLVASSIKDIDVIVHLAGIAHAISSTHEQLHKINVDSTKLLVTAAEEQEVGVFVFMSSSVAATTNTQGFAASSYGSAKLAAENL